MYILNDSLFIFSIIFIFQILFLLFPFSSISFFRSRTFSGISKDRILYAFLLRYIWHHTFYVILTLSLFSLISFFQRQTICEHSNHCRRKIIPKMTRAEITFEIKFPSNFRLISTLSVFCVVKM